MLYLEIRAYLERMGLMSGNQQDVLIVLIRQTQRAQEDAKGTFIYKMRLISLKSHCKGWTETLVNIGQNP
jgi:hypothetical protein